MQIVFVVESMMPEYNEGDRIVVDKASLDEEIAKGLHEGTGRPLSALLNHCRMVEGDDDIKAAIDTLMEGANEAVDPTIAAVDSARAVAEGKEYKRTPIKPADNGDTPPQADEAAIRAKGKEMGIRASHNMGIDKLKAKIAEVEAGD
jgi:hypothetical protein